METTVLETTLEVTNPTGLHARPAALFVKTAARFRAAIRVSKDGREVDAKSILGVLTLGARQNSTIRLRAEGDDAPAALAALAQLMAHNFGE